MAFSEFIIFGLYLLRQNLSKTNYFTKELVPDKHIDKYLINGYALRFTII